MPGCRNATRSLDYDIAVVGVPFDTGVVYRPGARFGPAAIRQASRLLKPYHPALDVSPFAQAQVVDAGDIAPIRSTSRLLWSRCATASLTC